MYQYYYGNWHNSDQEPYLLYSFSSKTGLVYSDQFIQITTDLASQYIYGIGEHVGNLSLDINWNTISLFSRDQAPEVCIALLYKDQIKPH